VAPGLLSRVDIVDLSSIDFRCSFRCLSWSARKVLVLRLCSDGSYGRVVVVFERNKYHQSVLGL
jgi:hypothetical protein